MSGTIKGVGTMQSKIQKFCKSFRRSTLHMTLKEVSEVTGINFRTISSFENGNSNNINHLYTYVVSCETPEQLAIFNKGIIEALNKGK